MAVGGAPRILITRLSHIGDCVLTLPLLHALRRHYPAAFIAWAMERPAASLLGGSRDLDQIILVPRGWLRSVRSAWGLRSELRSFSFDMVFDPQSLTKSAALGWLSGAPIRIGMARPHGREIAPWLNSCWVAPTKAHLVDRSLELLRGVGVHASSTRFPLAIDPTAVQFVVEHLPFPRGTPFIAINPGGTWRSKQWELDRFAEVAKFARDHLQLHTLVTWAGDHERAMAEHIVSLSLGAAAMAPTTNLKQLAALFTLSRMYLGGDTGPMHIAAAVETPCVALFGPTRPTDSGPCGSQHISLQAWYQSGSCRERRGAENLAMRDISVAQVCEAVRTIANRSLDRSVA